MISTRELHRQKVTARSNKIRKGVAITALLQILLFARGEEPLTTPHQILEAFYNNLFSERQPEQLPALFEDAESFALSLNWPTWPAPKLDEAAATAHVWRYLRDNRELFRFDGLAPEETVRKAALSYCFVGISDPGTFFQAGFCLELSRGIVRPVRIGTFKQIRFPLCKNERPHGPRYLVCATAISINGVSLDTAGQFDRSGNLYQQLGFKPVISHERPGPIK